MKPIYLKMSAFGSYAGVETIDFTDNDHGIFLITGDTGAGKTTIFDAIAYSLYDETSGGKRNGEMMRSQYADDDIQTFVELKFIYQSQTYTIIRYPKQTRISKKRNKDGEFTRIEDAPSVELIMPDGMPFRGKIKETNQKIIEIIGLDVNQFTQIAMIAQGDFLKLLHAPSKERKEIFAKIFNTRIYWRIEEELKSRAKQMSYLIEDNKKAIEREMEHVQCIEAGTYAAEWDSIPHFYESDPDKLLELIKLIIDEAKSKEEKINLSIKMKQQELDLIIANIQQAEATNKLFETLESLQKKKIELDAKNEEMTKIQDRIASSRKAALITPKETIYLAKQKDLADCNKRIQELKSWLEINAALLKQLKKLKDITETNYKKKYPELSAKVHQINSLIPKYEQYDKHVLLKKDLADKLISANSQMNVIVERYNKAKQNNDKLTKEQEELQHVFEELLSLTQTVDKLTEQKATLESFQQSFQSLHQLHTASYHAEQAYAKAVAGFEEKKHLYDDNYQHFIEGQAGILASNLEEGLPCPVCGSTSHPKCAASSNTNVSQKELKNAKIVMEDANQLKTTQYEAYQQAKQKYENAIQFAEQEGKKVLGGDFRIDTITEDELSSKLCMLKEQLKSKDSKRQKASDSKKKYDANTHEIKKICTEMETDAKYIEEAKSSIRELEINLTEAETTLRALKEALLYENKQAATAEMDAANQQVRELEAALNQATLNYQSLSDQMIEKQGKRKTEEESLSRLLVERESAEQAFFNELKQQKFTEVEDYHAAIIPAGKIEEMNDKYEAYRKEVIMNDANLASYSGQTQGKVKFNTAEMQSKKETLISEKSQFEEESKHVYGIRTCDEGIYHKVVKLTGDRRTLKENYANLNRLDQTANGKLSQCHMNFQTYIQRKYFNYVIREANKRLFIMSNNQFVLQCRDMKDLASQGEVGLDLDVYSMVNDQTRDVKTLSGGESFIAALAMALGMADIIQNAAGSIHIDTMFIDEGFGSLSEETRMQAIKILNELSNGKRLVGIISHVTELKAQIGTKLIVTKNEKGSKVKWERED